MIDKDRFNQALAAYKKQFDAWWPKEDYKWKSAKRFQECWDENAADFEQMFKDATALHENLLKSTKYFPKAMILEFAKADRAATRAMFSALFDEGKDLKTRIENFKLSSKKIRETNNPGSWNQDYQAENSISVYLWSRFPDKYYIYKYSEYEKVCKFLKANYDIRKGKKRGVDNLIEGFKMYDEICSLLNQDEEIVNILKYKLDTSDYEDKNLKTLTIDFGFFISRVLCDNKEDSELEGNDTETEINFDTTTKMKYEKYIKLLKANHNIVLTGAPGTGKTFLAKEIAKEMGAEVGFVQFHPSYDYTDFVEGMRPTPDGTFKRKDGVFKEFCKKALISCSSANFEQTEDSYHDIDEYIDILKKCANLKKCAKPNYPSYYNEIVLPIIKKEKCWLDISYQDELILKFGLNKKDILCIDKYALQRFLLGCPNTDDDERYEVVALIIRALYHKVYGSDKVKVTKENTQKEESFLFIIDEINRGEISKIFGELFFSIDPGYRGKKGLVQTQYQNLVEDGDVFKEGFFVPENVYIIGTMNDIDRSVEPMDFAMRRRFVWEEITAEDSAKNMGIEGEDLERMTRLNKQIAQTEGLDKDYQLGGAYFLEPMDAEERWNLKIKSLLKEYLRGIDVDGTKLEALRKAYFEPVEEE